MISRNDIIQARASLASLGKTVDADAILDFLVEEHDDAMRQLACERLKQILNGLATRAKYTTPDADGRQQALPGFEALHAFYPDSKGVMTPLDDLLPEECIANADRLDAEGDGHGVPRQREQGAAKHREAEQMRRWAALKQDKQESRA